MTTTLTKIDFEKSIQNNRSYFTEYKCKGGIYRIEFLDSFIKCAVQKTDEGVQIIYLDSVYAHPDHMQKLIGYVTFIIAHKINKNKPFREIELNSNGKIISIN